MQEADHLWLAILDRGGLAPTPEQLDLCARSATCQHRNDSGAGSLCATAAAGSSVACQHGLCPGSRIQLDLVVVSMQRSAHQGNIGASQRQSLLLPNSSPSHRQTRSTAQGWGEMAARGSYDP